MVQLEPGSIQTFQYFTRIFLHRFASFKKQPLTTLSLFGMKQQEKESLHAYLKNFNAKVVEFPSATSDFLINTFIQGLRAGDLFNLPVKNPSTSFENLLAKSFTLYGRGTYSSGARTQERHLTTKWSLTKKSCSSAYLSQSNSSDVEIRNIHFHKS